MRNLLNQFIRIVGNNEQFEREMGAYDRVLHSQEWKFVRDTLMIIKATILTELLSVRYTDLDAIEKDTEQRAYYNIVQIIDFLMEPTRWIKLKKQRLASLSNLKGKLMRARKEGK